MSEGMSFKSIDEDVCGVLPEGNVRVSIPIGCQSATIKAISIIPINDMNSANFDVEIFDDDLYHNFNSVYLAQVIPVRLDDTLDLYYEDKSGEKALHLSITNNTTLVMDYKIKIKYVPNE